MDCVFEHFKKIFNENGFRLYMVGSTSRDYLLNREILDYDLVTDATPDEVLVFLDADTTFKKYGTLKTHFEDKKIDIVTLRKESEYSDLRHPKKIEFIKDCEVDYLRRDLTINAIYIDENYEILDFSKGGYKDLKNHILRFIGDPEKRIKEDPLRILRAKRFAIEYNLNIDEKTQKILDENKDLLKYINQSKIEEENRKLQKAMEVKHEN